MAKPAKGGNSSPPTAPTLKAKSSPSPLLQFSKSPDSLRPFLELLSSNEIYLIHIDISSQDLKRQSFITSAAINIVITVIIAVRAYVGLHVYPEMLAALFGFTSSISVDMSTTPGSELAWIILRRMVMVIIDYFLVSLFLAWPIRFVAGPVKWRYAVGFREREVIVRRSRHHVTQNLERNRWIHEDGAIHEKIAAALTRERLKKPGYLLIDGEWDLDYDSMIRAHALVDPAGKDHCVPLDEFRTAALVNTGTDGWQIWYAADENWSNGTARATQRSQILAFRDRLASLGKEDLFFRWVEIIQYESTQPGGFTPDRQRSAMLQAKKLFEDEEVDFAQFWRDVGGMEGLHDLTL